MRRNEEVLFPSSSSVTFVAMAGFLVAGIFLLAVSFWLAQNLGSAQLTVLAIGLPVGIAFCLALFLRPLWSIPFLVICSVTDQFPWMTLPGIPFLTITKVVMFFGLSGWIISHLMTQSRTIRVFSYIWWYLAFAAAALVSSLIASPDLGESFRLLISLFTLPVVAVFIGNEVVSEARVHRLLSLLTVVGALLGGIALLQHVMKSSIFFSVEEFGTGSLGVTRAAAGQSNANELALLLVMVFPIPLFRLLTVSEGWPKIRNLTALLLIWGGLLVTQSRTGYLVIPVASLLSIPLLPAARRKFLVAAIVLLLLSGLAHKQSRARLSTLLGYIPRLETDVSGARYSVSMRVRASRTALEIFRRNPIFGGGWGSFRVRAVEYNRPFRRLTSVENTYLAVLCETGLVGTTLYLCFLVSLGRFFQRHISRRGPPGSSRGVSMAALFIGYVVFAIWNLFGVNLDDNLPWVVLGLFGALGLHPNRDKACEQCVE